MAKSSPTSIREGDLLVILSEEAALSKWCPMARSVGRSRDGGNIDRVLAGYNRDHESGQIPACIASSCMFWRFVDQKRLRDLDLVTGDIEEAVPRLGYCGMAGKPEHE